MKYRRAKTKYPKYTSQNIPSDSKKKVLKKAGQKALTVSFVISIVFSLTNFGIINRELLKKYVSPSAQESGFKLKIDNLYNRVCEYATEFFYVYLRNGKSDGASAEAKEEVQVESSGESDTAAWAEATKASPDENPPLPYGSEASKESSLQIFLPVRPCSGEITSEFGERVHPLTGEISHHNGADIACAEGDTVNTVFDGTVEKAAYNEYSGNYIIIRHLGGFTSSYAHLSVILVSEGENIKTGSQIGKAGSTGMATGPHLHFEIRKDGEAVNPFDYISGD